MCHLINLVPGQQESAYAVHLCHLAGHFARVGPDGLHIYDKAGTELGILMISHLDTALNLTWGGADGRDLFITCIGSVLRTRTKHRGYAHIQYLEGIFPRKA